MVILTRAKCAYDWFSTVTEVTPIIGIFSRLIRSFVKATAIKKALVISKASSKWSRRD
jgi:hypothetical protein